MEMLVYGLGGMPAVVFPSSCGRFYEFEDHGMVGAVRGQIEAGELQLFCADSVDAESWYNREVPPRWRIARHMQYEGYVLGEVIPFLRQMNWSPQRVAVGCSFGGYHAADFALRHPEVFSGFLSMGGCFDVSNFLRGYYDQDAYFHLPTHFLPDMSDPWFLDQYRRGTYVLATGVHDQCRHQNEVLAGIMREKGIPHRLEVWGNDTGHDWPWWQEMAKAYL